MPTRQKALPKAKSKKATQGRKSLAPRKTPSLDRGLKRVESLLSAAEICFAEAGFGATSMNGIARQAKASIGSLYQFFSSKEGVAAAIIEKYVAELKETWEALDAERAKGDYEDFSKQLVRKTLETIDRQPAFSTLEDAQANYGVRPGNHNELLLGVVALIARMAPSTDEETRMKLGLITFEMLKAAHGVHRNEVSLDSDIDISDEISHIIATYFRRFLK